jgi:hypothetical protein
MPQPDFGPYPRQNAAQALFGTTEVKISVAIWLEIMTMLAAQLSDGSTPCSASLLMWWWNTEDFWKWPRIARVIKTEEFKNGVIEILIRNKSPLS